MAEAQANVMVKDATPKKVMALASRKYSRDEKIKKDEEEIEKDETEKDLEDERERFAEKLVLFLDYFFSQLAISYKGDITFQGKKFSLKCFLTEAQLIKYGL